MEQFNGGRGSGQIAIAICDNNEGVRPHSTAATNPSQLPPSPPATDAEPHQQQVPPQVTAPEKPKIEHKLLSTTAKLGYFLPTGTAVLFETAVPKIYRNGQCSNKGTIMMWILLGLCVVTCFLSQFTDSKTTVNTKDGKKKVVYKILKWSESDCKDLLHAITSVAAFLTIAFSDQRVVDCVLPAHVKDVEEVMLSLEIMVLSVCSFLYLVFPISRSGLVPKLAYDGLKLEDNVA